jgi:hypothetical protein
MKTASPTRRTKLADKLQPRTSGANRRARDMRPVHRAAAIAISVLVCGMNAGTVAADETSYSGDLATRSTMTGDRGGARNHLAANDTVVNGDQNEFAHGKGDGQFFNVALNINPTLLLVAPASTLGAGAIVLPTKDPDAAIVSFSVLSSTGKASTSGFTPWMLITPDVQVVGPSQKQQLDNGRHIDTATVLGIRGQLIF